MKKNFVKVLCCVMALLMMVLCCSCGDNKPSPEEETPVVKSLDASMTEIAFVAEGVASYIDAASGKLGLIDSNGEIILVPEYKSVKFCGYCDDDGACIVTKDDGSEYTFRLSSKKLEDGNLCAHGLPEPMVWDKEQGCAVHILDEAYPVDDDELPAKGEVGIVYDKDGKVGLIGHDGELLIEPNFEAGIPSSHGVAAVKKNGKWGYINSECKEVIGFYYDDAFVSASCDSFDQPMAYTPNKDGFIVLQHDDIAGIYSAEGTLVCQFAYRSIVDMRDGNYACKNVDGSWIIGNFAGIRKLN